ncbi:NAD(P)-dependent oxidoreductase [Nocardia sp. CA-107356]|uniref:NAD(P)-dependent oxidoreductase n=1 Tax=Nocardia sp. CA-107356 TaxID=3239972 RepID=UPI003D902750
MVKIGVIGVGDMGAEIVPHLVSVGNEVAAFDARNERTLRAESAGARAAASPAEAASGADVVLGLVMSSDIPAAYFGPEGLLSGVRPGAVVVVASTTTPAVLDEIRAKAPSDVQIVDAPIVGGVRYARSRSITFLVGAIPEVFHTVEAVLSVLGNVRHVGGFGSGVGYKLVTNVAIMAAEAGIREALDLADLLGMDYATALDLMSIGPMAAVVSRALDTTNPRPLRRSAEDDDTLLSAVPDASSALPISSAGRKRLWEAVNANPDFEPDFVDITRRTTAQEGFRD